MKVFNGVILENGIVINIAEKQIPTLKDKKLQKIFDKYIELKKQHDNLNLKEKDVETIKFPLINNFEKLNEWFKNLEQIQGLRISLYNHNLMLKEIMKYFAGRIDIKDPNYKDKKGLFIYILEMYKTEIKKYDNCIKKAEKEIRKISFQSENTR